MASNKYLTDSNVYSNILFEGSSCFGEDSFDRSYLLGIWFYTRGHFLCKMPYPMSLNMTRMNRNKQVLREAFTICEKFQIKYNNENAAMLEVLQKKKEKKLIILRLICEFQIIFENFSMLFEIYLFWHSLRLWLKFLH